jgi:putative ABC transport system substrate-binding protein
MGFPEKDPLAQAYVTAFVQALKRFGWVEDKNIRIDYRFSAVDPTLLKTYAAELVGLSPDAILTGGLPAVAALQQQTRTIPIVFTGVGDPVGQGFVQSLARPGGNITGFGANDPTLMGKMATIAVHVITALFRYPSLFVIARNSSFTYKKRSADVKTVGRVGVRYVRTLIGKETSGPLPFQGAENLRH